MKFHATHLCRKAIFLLSLGLTPLVQAQTLDDLLLQAQELREQSNRLMEERASTFRAAGEAAQAEMMEQVEAERARLQESVAAITETYSENDLRIQQMNGELRAKANGLGLGELFGIARQVASDTTTRL